MNEQEKDLEKAEQDFYHMLLSLILFLNSNGMNLEGIKEMFDMTIRNAFEEYPILKKQFDKTTPLTERKNPLFTDFKWKEEEYD